jgi:hypothetical protein
MRLRDVLAERWEGIGPSLQRSFWKPLRNMMEIFHPLPPLAALLVFGLLATDGQFREIYIAQLEGPNGNAGAWAASIVTAFVALGLISAVLYEAHYSLSTVRLKVVYSSYANAEVASRLRMLQRTAAFILVLLPWLGIAAGLFGARNFVAQRYCHLLTVAEVPQSELSDMQHLLTPGSWIIAGALAFLGVAIAVFSSVDQQNRIAQRAVACVAPALAFLLFLLLTDWFNGGLPDRLWSRVTATYLLLAAATVLYVVIYHRLYRRRSGFIYSHPQRTTGISLRRSRRRLLVAWALLPWVLIGLYFIVVPYFVPARPVGGAWTGCPVPSGNVPLPGHWTAFPVAMCITIAVGLLIVQLLDRFATHAWRRPAIVVATVALFIAMAAMSSLSLPNLVWVYRLIGPVGITGVQLLFLISVFAVLAALSQRSGFPALSLVVLALILGAIFPRYINWAVGALGIIWLTVAVIAILSERYAIATVAGLVLLVGLATWFGGRPPQIAQYPIGGNPAIKSLEFEYVCWLQQRGIGVPATGGGAKQADCPDAKAAPAFASQSKPYPVYIIAAEGGGIYAASAASMFMAKLQDRVPHFAEHVFAVSGVSGGAIGSAIFQALDHPAAASPVPPRSMPQQPAKVCEAGSGIRQGRSHAIEEEVASVMEDDHFSPVVGSIFPELLGLGKKRPVVLEESFTDSVFARDTQAGEALAAPFTNHWSARAGPPALVLNTTWVETGFRVAFAPFRLNEIDEALYSFFDPLMPDFSSAGKNPPKLITAAAASARFPLILPPLTAVMPDKRWNFVDGGYADNSGATTALDLYRAMQKVFQPRGSADGQKTQSPVDLRIILISSSNPQPNLKDADINGTSLGDIMAPIDAIMKVRSDLGNDAVARACGYIYPDDAAKGGMETNSPCIEHALDGKSPLQIVEIQDQTYGLALGWRISRTSFDVVSWMLGEPDGCTCVIDSTPQEGAIEDPNAQLTRGIVQRNKCILNSIAEAVGAPPAAAVDSTPARSTGETSH